ncbi:SWIM zinc finger family protein [Bacillus paralicheniformis]|uniref:SWIM zinc finger family protein n=2 Tax=Bacillus paralicheniformis TaxID=1648923 RepID=UPI001FD724BB|nr:SWIM zinc finger family protein [Bacillus paralicheniformis]MCJ8220985.1 SWIM zinc finger domain-containing protein [Bacillus paralicheniformis]
MLQDMISKTVVIDAAEQFKHVLPCTEANIQLMKKALILYRQDSVYRVKPMSGHTVSAYVQDVVPVKVFIDLADVKKSSCSCPAQNICRHVLAVYLYLYAQYDRLGTFTEFWKEAQKRRENRDILGQLQRGMKPRSHTLDQWTSFFKTEFRRWEEHTPKNQQTMQYLYYGYFSALKKRTPAEPELKKMYQIHAALATWLAMHSLVEKGRIDPEKDFYSLNPYIEQLMDTIYSSIDELKTYALSFSLDPFLEKTPGAIRELLLKKDIFQYERLRIFGEIWSALLSRPNWLKRELDVLNDLEPSPEIQFGRLHLEFLLKNDDVILDQAGSFSPEILPYTFQWLSVMTAKKDWKRLKKWYEHLEQLASGFCRLDKPYREIRDVLSEFFLFLSDYSKNAKEEHVYERYCKKCLPYTFTEYSHFLYNKNRFTEWMEIHSLVGFSISEIGQNALKDIAAAAPEALIPSYHREISGLVEQKNRSSYKEAVKQLKKLRSLYKKSKKQDVWNRFMEQFSARYKRLRAFQEELKKGKLIDGES